MFPCIHHALLFLHSRNLKPATNIFPTNPCSISIHFFILQICRRTLIYFILVNQSAWYCELLLRIIHLQSTKIFIWTTKGDISMANTCVDIKKLFHYTISSHWKKAEVQFNPYSSSALEGVCGQHHSLAALFQGKKDCIHSKRFWAVIEDARDKLGKYRPHRISNHIRYSEPVYRLRHAGRLLNVYNKTK